MLLRRHFACSAEKAEIKRILLHEENQAVVHIFNALLSASLSMMVALHRFEVMLRGDGL
jgi:hypothetical protein